MFNFLLRIFVIAVLAWFVFQLPWFSKTGDALKADVLSKWNTVASEYTRIKGEIDTTVKNVNEFISGVKETKEDLDKTLDSLNKITGKTDAKADATAEAKNDAQ